jgi:hypothetical protein
MSVSGQRELIIEVVGDELFGLGSMGGVGMYSHSVYWRSNCGVIAVIVERGGQDGFMIHRPNVGKLGWFIGLGDPDLVDVVRGKIRELMDGR